MSRLKILLNQHVTATVTLVCWGTIIVIAAGYMIGEIVAAVIGG